MYTCTPKSLEKRTLYPRYSTARGCGGSENIRECQQTAPQGFIYLCTVLTASRIEERGGKNS